MSSILLTCFGTGFCCVQLATSKTTLLPLLGSGMRRHDGLLASLIHRDLGLPEATTPGQSMPRRSKKAINSSQTALRSSYLVRQGNKTAKLRPHHRIIRTLILLLLETRSHVLMSCCRRRARTLN